MYACWTALTAFIHMYGMPDSTHCIYTHVWMPDSTHDIHTHVCMHAGQHSRHSCTCFHLTLVCTHKRGGNRTETDNVTLYLRCIQKHRCVIVWRPSFYTASLIFCVTTLFSMSILIPLIGSCQKVKFGDVICGTISISVGGFCLLLFLFVGIWCHSRER